MSRLLSRIARRALNVPRRLRDLFGSTYGGFTDGPLARRFPAAPLPGAPVEAILDHRFDLLGSGPVRVRLGAECPGFEGRLHRAGPSREVNAPNLEESRRIRTLLEPPYEPIDWHLDFRSGFRWPEDAWYRDIRFGRVPGVDVKVPWELARMQHLPLLARAGGRDARREIRNEILDFMSANPPRYGVNWVCAMDVAIRAANWLVAWDLSGAAFDPPFERELARSIRVHAEHVAAHLGEDFPANHLLADLVGLLFCACYLPRSPETDAWRDFAVRGLVRETARQFRDDGGNFEASTAYHRLASEMVAWATALVPDSFPPSHFEKLGRMAEFAIGAAKPSGLLPLIGDEDGGRFLKLSGDEDGRDPRGLVAAIDGFFGRGGDRVETAIVAALAGRGRPSSPSRAPFRAGDGAALAAWKERLSREFETHALDLPAPPGPPELRGFPDFGLYVYRSGGFYLAVRCGSIGQDGRGGHAHNDQLGVELTVDGEDWFVDPGAYVYTALPELRNRYRSVRAHFAPQPAADLEPSGLDRGVFRLGGDPRAECLVFTEAGFLGVHHGFGSPVYRMVLFEADRVRVVDAARPGLLAPMLKGPAGKGCPNPAGLRVSPAYGRLA